MPVPAHVRVSLSGVLGTVENPSEIWAWGINLTQGVFADEADRVAFSTAVKDAWYANIAPLHNNRVNLTKVRTANVVAGGLVLKDGEGAYAQGDWNGVSPGIGTLNSIVPLQTACCVSLITNRSGASGKGRVFLPPLADAIDADFRYSAAVALKVANAFKDFISDVNFLDIDNANVAVVSSYGFVSQVTGCRVGRVPDTMRSRRNRLAEDYAVSMVG